MRKSFALGLCLGVAVIFMAADANADVVYPGGPWVSSGNSGGGSSEITSTAPDLHGGLGSIEMFGDRTRFEFIPGNVLGSLSELDALSFEWMVALDSTSNLHADYTPAVRLLIWDPVRGFGELIWEGAYNGYYGNYTHGTWVSTDVIGDGETLWRWSGGVTVDGGGAQVNLTPSGWAASSYVHALSVVYGVSFGVGSSVGSGYHAFGDYLTIGFDGVSTTYDFEPAAVVPVPPAIGLAGLGLALLAARRATRKKAA